MLSSGDARVAVTATALANRSPRLAATWLAARRDVTRVAMSVDRSTLEVFFRDSARFVIFPPFLSARARNPGLTTSMQAIGSPSHGPASGRALVLEPFADDLKLGDNAGKAEIDALIHAGFTVTVARNKDVTIPVVERLPDYSVIYMETHSNVIEGDAFVLTREVDGTPYKSLFTDGSVVQGSPANDAGHIYLAFKSPLIQKHMDRFPDSSVAFFNGCSILNAPVFIKALLDRNVGAVLGWENEAQNTDAEQAADFMFPLLAKGESVGTALAAARAALLDTSLTAQGVARLDLRGNTDVTLSQALVGATPTATATAMPATSTVTSAPAATATVTPTDTPTPIPHLHVSARGALKVNHDVQLQVTVRNATGSAPVAGAQVSVDGRNLGLSGILKKKTGSKGKAVFGHVRVKRAGTVLVKASKTGFATALLKLKAKR